jgi:hypothetical protein
MNLNQFKNLSRIKDLPTHEQNRQFNELEDNICIRHHNEKIIEQHNQKYNGTKMKEDIVIGEYSF